MPLILSPIKNIPLIRPGDDLATIIITALLPSAISLEDGDIFVITQKVVSKAENRFVNLMEIQASDNAIELANKIDKDPRLVEMILRESKEVLRYRPGTIIVEHRLGFVCANAGIDHSNVTQAVMGEEWILLLPLDPDSSAANIRQKIEAVTEKNVGVLIIDSHGRAWRLGVVGVTIGLSGIPALVDLRGRQDLFDYSLNITQVAAADELAAAASLMMGQAAERTPIIHVRGFPYSSRESSVSELFRPKELDLFR
jgi:coenzyme F420-0:L-glutamate ligase / coenzyme F420-1:gamma-L-glutamate ligase